MTFNISIFILSAFMFSVDIYLICSVWFRGKRTAYLKLFFAMGVLCSFWALLNGINLLLSVEMYQRIYPIVMIFVCTLPPVMMFYIFQFCNSPLAQLRPLRLAFTILPVIDLLILFTNPWHHGLISGYNGVHPIVGNLFIVHAVIAYVPIIIFLTVLFRYIIKNLRENPSVSLGIVGFGVLLPVVLNVLYTFNIFDPGFDITPFSFWVMFFIFAIRSIRLGMFDVRNTAITNLFSSLSDSFLIIDNTGHVADVNPSFKNSFPMFTLEFDKTGVDEFERFLESITLERKPEDIYTLMSSPTEEIHNAEITVFIGGETRYYVLSKDTIWQRGQFAGSIINLSDVSNIQRVEQMIDEISEKNVNLLELKDIAESASKAKSDFLARMSHEIRTPMNAIVGMSELILREEDISPVIYEHAVSIKHAGANLLSIINDVLDFSKIESGKLEIVPSEYLFTSLINDVFSIIRMRILEKPILFVSNIDSNIPNRLVGDEVRIRQVLLNLLGNSVKYTNEGFISVTVDGMIDGDDTVILTIEITDSGIGIKEEDIDRLFVDFVQVDAASNKGIQGTGLGLAIAKNLCLAMGGDISVYSEYGAGSTFTITLPQNFSVYEKLASVENPDEIQALIYEPRSIYANSIVCTIDNLGVRCTLADNQSELYEELKANPYNFIFVSTFLFESTKHIIDGLGLSSKIVLMAEFGEVVSYPNVRTIAMPAHSISIANIFNDVAEDAAFSELRETYIRFIAPTASILIVDDVSTNLKVAEGLMAPYKMGIDTCMSGAEAIELVKANRYDIIFMDHMMPEMDGVETTCIIRGLEDENGYYQNVPIVALTANVVSGVKEMFAQNGMNDFLAKPIDISKLNCVLERWIPHDKRRKYDHEKTAAEPVTVDFEIEGIDIKTGVSMTGGTVAHYLKTLTVFYNDGVSKINEIRDCMEKNDIHLYTTFVHAIKSASATIGAAEVSELARKLEAAGRKEDVGFIEENTDEFLRQLHILLQNIYMVTSKNTDNQSEAKPDAIHAELLQNELTKLKSALEDMDIGEVNATLSKLEAINWDKETSGVIYDISQSIILFEYDEAVAHIDKLLDV